MRPHPLLVAILASTACGSEPPAAASSSAPPAEPPTEARPAPSVEAPPHAASAWPATPMTAFAERLSRFVLGAMTRGELPPDHDFPIAEPSEGFESQDVTFMRGERPEGALRPVAVLVRVRALLPEREGRMVVSMRIWLTRAGLHLDGLEVADDTLGDLPPPTASGLCEGGADEVIRILRAGELDSLLLSPDRAAEVGLRRFTASFEALAARRAELEAVQARVRAAPPAAPRGYLVGTAAVFAEDASGALFRGTVGFDLDEDRRWVLNGTNAIVTSSRFPPEAAAQ